MSRYTRALLALLASAIVAMSGSGVSAAGLTADCVSHQTTLASSSTNTGAFTVPFKAGTGFVLTEGVSFSPIQDGDDVVNLGVTLAPAQGCSVSATGTTGIAHVQIGLYQLVSIYNPSTGKFTSQYQLQAQVPTITVGAYDVEHGITLSRAVAFDGLQPLSSANGAYYFGFATDNPLVCLEGNTKPTSYQEGTYRFNQDSLPLTFTATKGAVNRDYLATALVCNDGNVIGDPVFTGFHNQQFTVKGEAGSVFNILSTPTLNFNNRFVSLASDEESMSTAAQKAARAQIKATKMKAMVKGIPPVTAAWNHPGTYMGESGITLGDSQLYVAPGAYAAGFATVTLDGVAVPISASAIELDGDITVTRPSAFKLVISTPTVRFTLVNSDKFINIEHAKVMSADAEVAGLLGQTADAAWEVVQSKEFEQHIENDFKVASNKLF